MLYELNIELVNLISIIESWAFKLNHESLILHKLLSVIFIGLLFGGHFQFDKPWHCTYVGVLWIPYPSPHVLGHPIKCIEIIFTNCPNSYYFLNCQQTNFSSRGWSNIFEFLCRPLKRKPENDIFWQQLKKMFGLLNTRKQTKK